MRAMKPPRIKCRSCQGTGSRDLDGPHLKTFKTLASIGHAATAAEVHKLQKERVDVTAVNNRLRRMTGMGIVRLVNKRKPLKYNIK